MSEQQLSGWGRTKFALSSVLSPHSENDVLDEFAAGSRVIARGLGRSYGDAAQLSGGVVLDNRGFVGISEIDEHGVVSVGAGVSFDQLLTFSMPRGWFVPVTPGTRQVTMGGAVAADVHGKNHHVDGSFASHVLSLRLVTPEGVFTVSPNDHEDLFWATMGAMGLTGVVTSLMLRMIPITTNQVLVDTDRFENLESVMTAMSEGDNDYRYSVAWVDCMTRGAHLGRAILTRGSHASEADVEKLSLKGPRHQRLSVPMQAPSGLLNKWSVAAFNELWFRSAPRHEVAEAQKLSTFFYPLDGIGDWNRLYGQRGFVQYQFCVPESARSTIGEVIERLSDSRLTSFLGVLKRFGEANPAPLSFPLAGWTLALDMPVGSPLLPCVLDELDEMVQRAGGRVYLAKDARLSGEHARAMYPRLDEFLTVKARIDPKNQLISDLARRLDLLRK
ncbi:MAG TPA: FAD-binding oxidoreductase [Acidimicrobiales bacterium]